MVLYSYDIQYKVRMAEWSKALRCVGVGSNPTSDRNLFFLARSETDVTLLCRLASVTNA